MLEQVRLRNTVAARRTIGRPTNRWRRQHPPPSPRLAALALGSACRCCSSAQNRSAIAEVGIGFGQGWSVGAPLPPLPGGARCYVGGLERRARAAVKGTSLPLGTVKPVPAPSSLRGAAPYLRWLRAEGRDERLARGSASSASPVSRSGSKGKGNSEGSHQVRAGGESRLRSSARRNSRKRRCRSVASVGPGEPRRWW